MLFPMPQSHNRKWAPLRIHRVNHEASANIFHEVLVASNIYNKVIVQTLKRHIHWVMPSELCCLPSFVLNIATFWTYAASSTPQWLNGLVCLPHMELHRLTTPADDSLLHDADDKAVNWLRIVAMKTFVKNNTFVQNNKIQRHGSRCYLQLLEWMLAWTFWPAGHANSESIKTTQQVHITPTNTAERN